MKHSIGRYTLALAVNLALWAPFGRADDRPFTDNFLLDQCKFESEGRNAFFILEPGFQLVLEGDEGDQFVHLEITVLPETRKVMGVETRVVEERETRNGELSEIARNYFAICEQNGGAFYFGEDARLFEHGVVTSTAGSWEAGVKGARAGLIMPSLPLLGARYFQEVAPGVALDRAEIVGLGKTIRTPAGRFRNTVRVVETTPLEPDALDIKIHAPGVGLVQAGPLKLVYYSPGFKNDARDDTDEAPAGR